MYKEIELGCSVPETGEPRVRYLDRNAPLTKTASEIQRFWDTLEKNDEYAYLWVIGVSAMEYYGCNNNGDAFHEEDLKKTYQDFVSNAYIYLHHVNKDPKRSIGRPIYAWYNDDMHRIELVLAIKRDAEGAQAIVERIKNGEQMYVSMGCKVKFDVCSICGHQAKTRALYCDHLKYNLKKILPDGRQVYAINPNPKFFDISMVTRPADPTAFALDKIAEQHGYRKEPNALLKEASLYASDFSSSSVDGEDIKLLSESLHKTADILKEVDGRIVDSKFPDQVTAVKDIASQGFDKIEYPADLDYPALERLNMSPVGLIRVMSAMRAPLSFEDMFWSSGLSGMDVPRHRIFAALPSIMHSVAERPSLISRILDIFRHSYNGELEEPVRRTLIIKITMPVASARSEFISGLMKSASMDRSRDVFGRPTVEYSPLSGNRLYGYDRNFAQVHVVDQYGKKAVTTPFDIQNAHPFIPNRYADDKARGGPVTKGIGLNDLVEHFAVTVGLATCQPVMEKATVLEDTQHIDAPASRNEVPVHLVMESDHKYEKTAGFWPFSRPAGTPEQVEAAREKKQALKANKLPWWKCRAGTLLGAGIPGALMLDYKYNQMKGTAYETGDVWHDRLIRAGKFVNDHPIATMGIGSMVGSRLPI